jgi:alkanesulfonate monooxygenase SsuD/methylene tetrahydromethanopterin reductase-like flavin-dependent oxidoreductase (luciferase family)
MQFAIDIPNFGIYSDPRLLAELAHAAEEAGWDGFFLCDHIIYTIAGSPVAMADPWIQLAAIALSTTRIKLGPMVTPLPRRRPWKLARETVTLDHLAQGRLILGVGLGNDQRREYSAFGETADPKLLLEPAVHRGGTPGQPRSDALQSGGVQTAERPVHVPAVQYGG